MSFERFRPAEKPVATDARHHPPKPRRAGIGGGELLQDLAEEAVVEWREQDIWRNPNRTTIDSVG